MALGAQSAWLLLPTIVLGSPILTVTMFASFAHWNWHAHMGLLHIVDVIFATIAFFQHFQWGWLALGAMGFFGMSKYLEEGDHMNWKEFVAHTLFRLCAIMMVLPDQYMIIYTAPILVHTLWMVWNQRTTMAFHILEIWGTLLLMMFSAYI